MSYGTAVTLQTPFAETAQRLREELKAEGFGVLTEINVADTMREKLGETIEEYIILGACNPPLAHRALSIDRSIGLLLPCNVVVRAGRDGTVVEAMDPRIMVKLSGSRELESVADDAAARLRRVLERVNS